MEMLRSISSQRHRFSPPSALGNAMTSTTTRRDSLIADPNNAGVVTNVFRVEQQQQQKQREPRHQEHHQQRNVFLFVPNIIGYLRLLLVFASWIAHALRRPNATISLLISAAILDFFDGFAARRLRQSSVFGAWFDVCIDVVARTATWNMIFSHSVVSTLPTSSSSWAAVASSFPWGQLIASLEWLAFVCNHAVHGSRWKTRMMASDLGNEKTDANNPEGGSRGRFGRSPAEAAPPAWVSRCFADGFKSPLGVFVISGIHALPLWLYGYFVWISKASGLWFGYEALMALNCIAMPFLIAGRIYAACVECWVVWDHVRYLASLKED